MSASTKTGILIGLYIVLFMASVALLVRAAECTTHEYAECREQGIAPDICLTREAS